MHPDTVLFSSQNAKNICVEISVGAVFTFISEPDENEKTALAKTQLWDRKTYGD